MGEPGTGTGPDCCCEDICNIIRSQPSGTLFQSEDGTLIPITKPMVYSRLVFNTMTGFAEWEALEDPEEGGGEGTGEGATGNYSYSCQIEGWVGGPGETPSCADPGLPPFPTNEVGATAIYECSTGEWTYYPPP